MGLVWWSVFPLCKVFIPNFSERIQKTQATNLGLCGRNCSCCSPCKRGIRFSIVYDSTLSRSACESAS